MSTLYLGSYTCEYNRVDKTDYITFQTTSHNVTIFENDTNEDYYTIILDMEMEMVRQFNYCKIDGKEFFLEPVRAIDGGMCEIKATADVLFQNRELIYNTVQLVERNAKNKNAYLDDPMMTFASYDTIACVSFPQTSSNVKDTIILITAG